MARGEPSRSTRTEQDHHPAAAAAAGVSSSSSSYYYYGLPATIIQPALVGYRSVGIGAFGATMRWAGMPLEKIALYMNSSQVSGPNPFGQAVRLTFANGVLSPYRVVGPASLTAWFMQYSVMGVAFQFFDQVLSSVLQVRPMYYGKELMDPPEPTVVGDEQSSALYQTKAAVKTVLSPLLAATLESFVSNRAEAQRFFGPVEFAALEKRSQQLGKGWNPLVRAAGPAFGANVGRNVIMCQTSFLLTPLTYKLYFPQEHKNKSTLFWYGLSLNIFVGNVVAITQQALWGRSLDYWQQHGRISYRDVIQHGLSTEGSRAFFTLPKWCSRVLMNAPAQGTLPWFYNEILPLGEDVFLKSFKTYAWDLFLSNLNNPLDIEPESQQQRPHYATLPTANPEFTESSVDFSSSSSSSSQTTHRLSR